MELPMIKSSSVGRTNPLDDFRLECLALVLQARHHPAGPQVHPLLALAQFFLSMAARFIRAAWGEGGRGSSTDSVPSRSLSMAAACWSMRLAGLDSAGLASSFWSFHLRIESACRACGQDVQPMHALRAPPHCRDADCPLPADHPARTAITSRCSIGMASHPDRIPP